MIDLMLLAGSALCVISIVMAIISVAQTRAPRHAAIALILGLVLLFAAAWMQPAALGPQQVMAAWQRLFAGEIRLEAPATTGAQPVQTP